MDGLLIRNIKNAKWVIGGFATAHTVLWYTIHKPKLESEVFGWDGNGGRMLKIITDLTDEEIARLKAARRTEWHTKALRSQGQGMDSISDQELSDRGIATPQEPYVEYMKRPPHDKYL